MGELMKTLIIITALLVVLVAGSAPAREISPMMMEIFAAQEAMKLEIADLKLQYDAAGSNEQAMEIMHEMARVKKESRVEMMRIQLRYARLAGNEEQIAELEVVIAKMTAPPAKGTPISREAPQR
jgi:hypothetical protein